MSKILVSMSPETLDAAISCLEAVASDEREPERYRQRYAGALAELRSAKEEAASKSEALAELYHHYETDDGPPDTMAAIWTDGPSLKPIAQELFYDYPRTNSPGLHIMHAGASSLATMQINLTGQFSLTARADRVIADTLRECAPDLNVGYCFWPERNPAGDVYARHTAYHFETTFLHPDLAAQRCGDMSSETSWPPFPDEVQEAVRKAVASLRKMRAVRLHQAGKLPESGWERDLAAELKLDEEIARPSS